MSQGGAHVGDTNRPASHSSSVDKLDDGEDQLFVIDNVNENQGSSSDVSCKTTGPILGPDDEEAKSSARGDDIFQGEHAGNGSRNNKVMYSYGKDEMGGIAEASRGDKASVWDSQEGNDERDSKSSQTISARNDPFSNEEDGGGDTLTDNTQESEGEERLGKRPSVTLCRKVLPELEEEENVCSICLDEFSEADPSAKTVCGHGYHLQCIMQWAQRSRECPLCFHGLQMEDPAMNELLPFGEYISPQQAEAESSMLATWELESFLVRLAAAERRERRAHRRSRMSRNQAEQNSHENQTTGQGEDERRADMTPERQTSNSEYSSSWPPGAHSSSGQEEGSSPIFKSASQSFKSMKSRFAALKLRDTISKTTQDLKSLFGSPSSPSSSSRQQ